jgi:hypothetical protein
MSDNARYSLEDDIETAEADAASRDLPQQIAKVRARIREARARLSANDDSDQGQGQERA